MGTAASAVVEAAWAFLFPVSKERAAAEAEVEAVVEAAAAAESAAWGAWGRWLACAWGEARSAPALAAQAA